VWRFIGRQLDLQWLYWIDVSWLFTVNHLHTSNEIFFFIAIVNQQFYKVSLLFFRLFPSESSKHLMFDPPSQARLATPPFGRGFVLAGSWMAMING